MHRFQSTERYFTRLGDTGCFSEYYHKAILSNIYTDTVWSWMQIVAPIGFHFYSKNEFAAWKNNTLLVGGLAKGILCRLNLEGETKDST